LIVPAEALIPDIQGQKVLLMKGGKVVSARVQLGIRSANSVQLTSGVQPGDSVIVTGLLALARWCRRASHSERSDQQDDHG
jgi:membrane fusion protein (multidrug efflux system)